MQEQASVSNDVVRHFYPEFNGFTIASLMKFSFWIRRPYIHIVHMCIHRRLIQNEIVHMCIHGRPIQNEILHMCIHGRLIQNEIVYMCIYGRLMQNVIVHAQVRRSMHLQYLHGTNGHFSLK